MPSFLLSCPRGSLSDLKGNTTIIQGGLEQACIECGVNVHVLACLHNGLHQYIQVGDVILIGCCGKAR